MNHPRAVTRVEYGQKLVNAGITGIRTGQDSARGEESLRKIAADAARDSLAFAAIGACVGLLQSQFADKRDRRAKALALGALGSVLGFCVGFGWKTRKVTSSVAHSTARELRRVRDEHWLELNPIDYA
jgi:hypothetical protein